MYNDFSNRPFRLFQHLAWLLQRYSWQLIMIMDRDLVFRGILLIQNRVKVLQNSMFQHNVTNGVKLVNMQYRKFSKCKILVGKILMIQHPFVKIRQTSTVKVLRYTVVTYDGI